MVHSNMKLDPVRTCGWAI